MQYGQILDTNYNPDHETTYKAFVDYFGNPLMTKIKNVQDYSMYLAKIHCLLSNQFRYLITFISKDNNSRGVTESLSNLYWESIQTRTMEDNHKLKSHTYAPRNMKPLTAKIDILTRDKEKSTYKCEELSLEVTLLHKRGDVHEYNNRGTVVSALETYNTIITFKK